MIKQYTVHKLCTGPYYLAFHRTSDPQHFTRSFWPPGCKHKGPRFFKYGTPRLRLLFRRFWLHVVKLYASGCGVLNLKSYISHTLPPHQLFDMAVLQYSWYTVGRNRFKVFCLHIERERGLCKLDEGVDTWSLPFFPRHFEAIDDCWLSRLNSLNPQNLSGSLETHFSLLGCNWKVRLPMSPHLLHWSVNLAV
jgi:hypothetical protein